MQYTVSITATNASGSVTGSSTSIYTALTAPIPVIISTTATTVTVQVNGTNNPPNTVYQIGLAGSGNNWLSGWPVNYSAPSYTFTGLSPGTPYNIGVTASLSGAGSASDYLPVTTNLDTPQVTIQGATPSSVTLGWNAVTNATSYTVEDGSGNVLQTATGTNAAFNNLTPDTSYKYQVIAVNANAQSAAAVVTVVTTLSSVSLSIVLDNGSQNTSSASVPVTLTAEANGASSTWQMQDQVDNGSWSGWVTYAASTTAIIPATAGAHTVIYEIKDSYGETAQTSSTIIYTITPTLSVQLDSGATTTTNPALNVVLTGAANGNAWQMRDQINSGAWSSWMPYDQNTTLTLPSTPGSYTVIYELQDADNQTAQGSAQITLQALAYSPTGSTFSYANITSSSFDVTVQWTVSGEPNGVNYEITCPQTGTSSGWGTATSYTFTGLSATGQYYFDIFAALDSSGDGQSAPYQTPMIDGQTVTMLNTTSNNPVVSIQVDSGQAATTDQTVNVAITASGRGLPDNGQMQYQINSGSWSGWVPFASTTTVTLPGTPGLDTITFAVEDQNDNQSQASAQITYQTSSPGGIPPTISTLAGWGGATCTTTGSISLELDAVGAIPGQLRYRYQVNNGAWSSLASLTGNQITVSGLTSGVNVITVGVDDVDGNESLKSVTIFEI